MPLYKHENRQSPHVYFNDFNETILTTGSFTAS